MKITRLAGVCVVFSFVACTFAKGQDSTIVLRFGGDCLLADSYERAVGDSLNVAFTGFELLRDADLAMVNLESPVTLRGERVKKPFNFRMHPKFLATLKEAGIGLVNIANNHIYDYDSVGLYDTIVSLDSVGILHVGAGRNQKEAHKPVVLNLRGRTIGFLGYYGGSEAPPARGSKPGVAERTVSLIVKDIAQLKSNGTDFIVVNLHWGTEKAAAPEKSQIHFAHTLIDAGVDVVVGHHPHVLQGVEKYGNGVIAYSLGNFIFGGKNVPSYDTALLEVRLHGRGVEYELLPVRLTDWNARALDGSSADSIRTYVSSLSSMFSKSIFHFQEAD